LIYLIRFIVYHPQPIPTAKSCDCRYCDGPAQGVTIIDPAGKKGHRHASTFWND